MVNEMVIGQEGLLEWSAKFRRLENAVFHQLFDTWLM
jgi:hypothetical protein